MGGIVYLFGSLKLGIQYRVLIKLLFSICFKGF